MNEKGTARDGWRSQPRPAHWQKIRRRVLRRDGYLCYICRRNPDLYPADSVDHIVPVSQGGSDEDDNLAACHEHPCHAHKTALEANAAKPKRKREPEKHPGLIDPGGG